MCELVSGANTVDSDEVCAVVFTESACAISATSATSAKVRPAWWSWVKHSSAASERVCGIVILVSLNYGNGG